MNQKILEIDHFKKARLATLIKYPSNDIQFIFRIKQDGQLMLKKYEFQIQQFQRDIQKRYESTSVLQKCSMTAQQFGDIHIQEIESFFKYLQTGHLCIDRNNLLCYTLMALHFQCQLFFKAAFDAQIYTHLTSNKELSLLLINLLDNIGYIREQQNKNLKDIIGIIIGKGIDLFIDKEIIDINTIKLMSDKSFNMYVQMLANSSIKKNANSIKNYCQFVQTFYKQQNLDSLELTQKVDVLLYIINHIQLQEKILFLLADSINAETIQIFMEYLSEKVLVSNLKNIDEDQQQIFQQSEEIIQEFQLELNQINEQIQQAKKGVENKQRIIIFLKQQNGYVQ